MKKIYLYILYLLPVLAFSQNGGVNIGGGGAVNHDSAILQIDNLDKKGVLFPQVELLDDLGDKTTPILNPINGMIIYNIGNAKTHGYYYWDTNQWKLMGDSNNIVRDAVFRMTTATSVLGGIPINTFQDMTMANWVMFSNNIFGLSGTGNGTFTLPAGNYLVHVNANIDISTLNTTAGVASTDLHLIKILGKIYDGTTILGIIEADNGVLRSTDHTFSSNLDFVLKLNATTTAKLALAMDTGGTYSNGVGGTGTNNGAITISNLSIHFQRTNTTP